MTLQLVVENWSFDRLRVNPRNARVHSAQQIDQIASSIRRLGFNNPVGVTAEGMILAGHARWAAAKKIGMREIPVICLSHLTAVEQRAYMIADNKLALNAGWDIEILASEIEMLVQLEFDVPVLGFSQLEMDQVIDQVGDASTSSTQDDDDILPLPPKHAVTRTGDIWELGRHRLICGDAREAGVYDALLENEPVDLILTDPPYNLEIAKISGSGKVKHREFAMASGEMKKSDFTDFLSHTLGPAAQRCRDGALAYVFMDWRHLAELTAAGEKIFTELKNLVIWNKRNAGQGAFYRSKHELIFIYKSGKAPHINNFSLGQGGRSRSNVWDYAGVTSIGKERSEALKMHPTVKPVAMLRDAILDVTNRGNIVLDIFAGSGSTLIAAERTGRTARVIEIDPLYCDIIIARFRKLTGKEAMLLNSGQCFDDVTNERAAA